MAHIMLFMHILICPPKLSLFRGQYHIAMPVHQPMPQTLGCLATHVPQLQASKAWLEKIYKERSRVRSPPGHAQCYASPTPRSRAGNPDGVSLCPDYHLPPREQAGAGSYSWTREGIRHTEKAYFFGRRSAGELGRTKHKSGLTALQFCLPSGTTSRLARGKTNRSIP